jgi:hypothetical protein
MVRRTQLCADVPNILWLEIKNGTPSTAKSGEFWWDELNSKTIFPSNTNGLYIPLKEMSLLPMNVIVLTLRTH